jgi:hypothetical protein
MDDPHRATRDIDLLASGASHEAAVRGMMETICQVACAEDGIEFDLESLSVAPIRGEQRHSGQRAVLRAHLGKPRVRPQVEFGFGDVLPVAPEEAAVPTLIDRAPPPTTHRASARTLAWPPWPRSSRRWFSSADATVA